MRILYVAGNRYGAGIQAKRIIDNLKLKGHEIKVAAFLKSSTFLKSVDWTLDALYSYNKKSRVKDLLAFPLNKGADRNVLETLMSDISLFEPELVICDHEYIIANIAKTFKYPLWYCSPIYVHVGTEMGTVDFKYDANIKKFIYDFYAAPPADRVLVYSPIGDYFRDMPRSAVEYRMPQIRTGYEWISPYFIEESEEEIKSDTLMIINNLSRLSAISEIASCSDNNLIISSSMSENVLEVKSYDINDIDNYKKLISGANKVFSTGDVSSISDAFYNNKSMIISPDLNDPESMINSYVMKRYYTSVDIGQFELADKYAVGILNSAINKKKYPYLVKRRRKEVHKLI